MLTCNFYCRIICHALCELILNLGLVSDLTSCIEKLKKKISVTSNSEKKEELKKIHYSISKYLTSSTEVAVYTINHVLNCVAAAVSA